MAEPQNGRIGGGVLADNLLRNGIDLAFETDLLYLNLASNAIGINTSAPTNDLTVNSQIGAVNLNSSTYLNVADLSIQNSEIQSYHGSGNLNINAANNIFATSIATDNIKIDFNTISTTTTNTNLELRPDGSGTVELVGNTNITGSLHATGDITFGGNLTLGNDDTDNVEFASDVDSNIIPNSTNTSSLGSSSKRWKDIYSNLLNGQRVEVGAFAVSDTSLARRQGNIFYVSTLGSDTNVGDHQHGAFRTIEHALAVADSSTAGPVTIFIYPGEYEENLPLIVPENTTITGEDLRNTIIKPAAGSESLDVFHLNQNTIVENVTIKDFQYDSINDTGYAFRFASGAVIAERSPYVRNVSVLTAESGSSTGPYGTELFDSADYPGSGFYLPTGTYSVGVEKATTPANFDTIAVPGTIITCWITDPGDVDNVYTVASIGTDPSDPFYWEITFNEVFDIADTGKLFYVYDGVIVSANDAGRGALIDGSVLDSNTTSPSMLFHSATFITPNADCITMTNGVRVEWLNSFTYFANRGLYATQGTAGFAGLGSVFGAEVRSIGSANVYGNYAAVADGADTLMYLIGHNFAYIGAGLDYSNDRTLTLQDQEAVELNSGRIYYTSTDADGTFRVGNAFYVDFEQGTTSIDASSIDFSGVSAFFIRTGPNITYIDGERIDTGNIRFSGNTIETLDGDLIWSPATGVFDVDTNNTGFIIPRGTTAQRTNEESDLRYNTTTNLFEGFSSANVAFGGVYSDDRRTKISADNVLGNIVFTANSVETARVSTGLLELNGLTTGDVYANLNVLRTTQSNSNLDLTPNGTGSVLIDNLSFNNSSIENSSSTDLTLANTLRGYVKFDATTGLVFPAGTSAERPSSPSIGSTRWNTDPDKLYMETWNGSSWVRASGEDETTVTEEVINEIVDLYTLVLG